MKDEEAKTYRNKMLVGRTRAKVNENVSPLVLAHVYTEGVLSMPTGREVKS